MAELSLLLYNFSAGLLSFFSPCGFPMLPAYLAYYLPRGEGEKVPMPRALARGLGGGMLAAVGAMLVLGAIAALAVLVGAPFKQRVATLELVGGILVVGLGVLVLLGRGPSFKIPLSPTRKRSALGLVGFGALYAGVAASCVAPILISVVVVALAAPTPIETLVRVLAYAAGMASLLVVVTVLVAAAQHKAVRALRNVLPHVERVTGVLLVVVGLYLMWFWAAQEFGIWVPQVPTPTF